MNNEKLTGSNIIVKKDDFCKGGETNFEIEVIVGVVGGTATNIRAINYTLDKLLIHMDDCFGVLDWLDIVGRRVTPEINVPELPGIYTFSGHLVVNDRDEYTYTNLTIDAKEDKRGMKNALAINYTNQIS